jgi:Domain of Unknown Function (DUF748)/OmpA family
MLERILGGDLYQQAQKSTRKIYFLHFKIDLLKSSIAMVAIKIPSFPIALKKINPCLFKIAISILLLITASSLLPQLFRLSIEHLVSNKLGRALHIDTLHVHPWSTTGVTIELNTVTLGSYRPSQRQAAVASQQAPLAALKRLKLTIQWTSILEKTIFIDDLQVEGLHLNIARTNAGHYTVDDLIALAAKPSTNTTPVPYALKQVQISASALHFDDQVLGVQHRINHLNVALPFFNSRALTKGDTIRPHLSFQLNEANFDAAVQFNLRATSQKVNGSLKIKDFNIASYLDYWPVVLPVRPLSGVLHTNIGFDFSNTALKTNFFNVQAQIDLNDWVWIDAQSNPLASWSRMHLDLQDVQPLAQRGKLINWRVADFSVVQNHLVLGELKAQISRLSWQGDTAFEANATNVTQASEVGDSRSSSDSLPTTGGGKRSGFSLITKGDLSLQGLRVSAAGVDWVTGKALNLSSLGIDFSAQEKPALQWQSANLQEFSMLVLRDENGALNWQKLFPVANQPKKTQASPPKLPIDLALGLTRMSNGRINFSDQSVTPQVHLHMEAINASISHVNTTNDQSAHSNATEKSPLDFAMTDIRFEGKIGAAAELDIQGLLNPLAPLNRLDLRLRLDDFDLPLLAGYAVQLTGHSVTRGKLDADMNYRIGPVAGAASTQHKLVANNQLTLSHLSWSDRQAESVANLPVHLATALLRDTAGDIYLDVPLAGTIEDPDFSIARLIWHFFQQLIGKAVSSPFALLSDWFHDASNQVAFSHAGLNQIAFESGSAALDLPQQKQLKQVATLLIDKPQLVLTIDAQASTSFDHQAQTALAQLAAHRASAIQGLLVAFGIDKHRLYLGKLSTLIDKTEANSTESYDSDDVSTLQKESLSSARLTVTEAMATLHIGL